MTHLWILSVDENILTWYSLKELSKNNYRPQYNRKDTRSLIFIKIWPALAQIKSQNRDKI